MSSWSIVCMVDGTPVTHLVLADTAEEAINKVIGESPNNMREIQQVRVLNIGEQNDRNE